ncbi:MAG: efflux RND transporter periplasmic adaptor subunit [Phycisphaerae bacterium]|nr:efflux RND transporter periplasmic adaptor subunit [Phycisphaerae bacterium]
MKYMKQLIFSVIILLIAGGIFFWIRKRTSPAASAQMQSMPVTVARPVIQDVVNYNEFTGNLASVESVDIRARVQGYLKRVAFDDGAFVKKGDLLFEIEPETYKADRDRALAALKSAEADLNRAQQDYERVMEAVKSNAVSKQEVGTYKAQRDMTEASFIAAKAALDQAELNLSYTKIESPIDGKISRNYVDAGNLVGSGENTLLANVVKLDPIYVYFNASESEYLNYTKNVQENLAEEPNKLPVYISLANNEDYAHQGRLDYMDNRVDPATGTIQIRGVVPNPDNQLYPGMFVRIRVPSQTVHNAVLIPEKAVMTDLGGKYVLAVGENNILYRRDITLGATIGQLRVVSTGLDGSEMFAAGSFHFIRPGMPITPISGDGPPPGMAPGNPAAPEQSDTEKPSEQQ